MAHAYLSWTNVLIALSLLALDIAVSVFLRLELASSLIIAALRCIVQLSVMGVVLRYIFSSESAWAVAGLSASMLLLVRFALYEMLAYTLHTGCQ
jgi:ABC-type iron transport system FetAB permease component